jgi:ATP-dependent helicase/nuclease subunit A
MSALTPDAMRKRAIAVQRKAAEPADSVWVVASAGTGKTSVLTDRSLRLLLAGSPPERLLCLTFTKAAAAEMANRIAERLGQWVVMSEDKLTKALDDLLGRAANDGERDLARRLFARVLDTPGGMRIMTIHAFCQSLLRRFPIEAGIAPHFELLDERRSEELLLEARDELLDEAGEAEEGELTSAQAQEMAQALAHVSQRVNEQDFADLLGDIIHARGRVEQLLLRHGGRVDGAIEALRARLSLAPGETAERILAAGIADAAFDGANLRLAAAALAQGTEASDQPRGRVIADFLAAEPAERVAEFEEYAAAFLTDEGIRKRLATAAVVKRLADVVAILQREGQRILDLKGRLRAAELAEATKALLTLGHDILARYGRIKDSQVALDYDDLILTARDLLRRPGVAPWVLFKLDGGLDHILVDEAQDTNPAQWEVITALAEEFFVGQGASASQRTIFAVGDVKQSIFSFQGADPLALGKVRAHFERRLTNIGGHLQDVPLSISFRSTETVLSAVDAIFAQPSASAGVALDGRAIAHQAARLGQAGRIEIWPLAEPADRAAPAEWRPPRERRAGDSPRERLARLIARRIGDMIADKEILQSRGRALRPGDFLILVRHRDALVESLVREMKNRGIAVAGNDRMRLGEQLAVMDLMAFGQFLLLPEDDFNLAVLLKSPLLGLGEDALFDLAAHRGRRSLWAELQSRPDHAAARDFLSQALAKADFLPPHELYADLLGRLDGRRRLLARLGPDAADPIEEFMNLALAYESEHTPSLQGFLHWLGRDDIEIKREGEPGGAGLVRIMTVHGAKGLQAPIVFLPDTLHQPKHSPRLLWLEEEEGELLLWSPRVDDDDPVAAAARARAKAARDEEGRRLLYVALTRAEDRLYVCGWRGSNRAPADCWYETIRQGMAGLAEPTAFDFRAELGEAGWAGEGLVLEHPQTGAPSPDAHRPRGTGRVDQAAAAWMRQPPPPEPRPARPLSPSRLGEEPPVLAPLEGAGDQRFRRGRLIHRLLQSLPDLPVEARAEAAKRFLDRRAGEIPAGIRAEIAQETLVLLADPGFAAIFGPGSRAEAPIVGELANGTVISGQIDRLLVTPSQVLIVDFKTNRPAPRTAGETAQPYLRQMAAYRHALGRIYPDRTIRCALLWTEEPRLMELPAGLLESLSP